MTTREPLSFVLLHIYGPGVCANALAWTLNLADAPSWACVGFAVLLFAVVFAGLSIVREIRRY